MATLAPPQLSAPATKTSWADELDEDELPPSTEKIDPVTGIKTIVEYKWDETGEKKIKTVRKIKRTLVTTRVSPTVAARKGWAKFGLENGKKSGPDLATTTLGEAIKLKIAVPGLIKEPVVEQTTKATIVPGGKRITCRLCQGDHFTASCPYKDTLGGVLGGDAADQDQQDGPGASQAQTNNAAGGGTGKYVPPSQRDGAKRGESMQKSNRDDLPTLRVTNLSEDVQESDLWDLFGRFGRISRIYVGKDQETGLCKGFAFVSFEDRMEAERAMKKINGLPYDHLILGCMWSLPRGEREAK
ncbi:translation initiation factor eIF3 subunit g [Puccinia graminis f. sp. tritici]|uniref:Eukaryotic translation initiation factor 3 subunit G n=1 Tax=Puccinia graminis f. sp. tritici TaxID=56615 RepID=A0A5B0MDT4_PUCGR|nr:translation initiation factor eIF3 subunit g [Puccinia graminis f. sp. tritici]